MLREEVVGSTLLPEQIVEAMFDNRDKRWRRRRRVRNLVPFYSSTHGGEIPSWKSCASCGNCFGAGVSLIAQHGVVRPVGVIACSNVWVCAVCSARIRVMRQVELQAAAQMWVRLGGELAMATFTVRHKQGMALRQVVDSVVGGWSQLSRWKSFLVVKSHIVGYVRALEVTVGDNGWHPHLHVLLFVKGGVGEDVGRAAVLGVTNDWRRLVTARLGLSPSVSRSVNFVWFGGDSDYAAKYVMKIARELTMADVKSGRDPFMLLDGEGYLGSDDIVRFIEYADTMRGRQSIAWSKGLRQMMGLLAFTSDEALLESEVVDGDMVLFVSWSEWNTLMASGMALELIKKCEREYAGSGMAPVVAS